MNRIDLYTPVCFNYFYNLLGNIVLLIRFIIVAICKENYNCYKKGIAAQCKKQTKCIMFISNSNHSSNLSRLTTKL